MRIFIDCSYIDFHRQPTGIPRVVLQYIECGYQWAATSGVQVIPVVTTPSGLVPVRPVPGKDAPDYLAHFDTNASDASNDVSAILEQATFHMQHALVQVGRQPDSVRCQKAVRSCFDRLVDEGNVQAIDPDEGDVLFCPAYWHDVPPKFFRSLQQRGCKIVTLVHDILPITFSKFYQAPWKFEFEKNLLAHLRHSDAVMAVSQYTADSIMELAERRGIGGLTIDVAYNGYYPLVSDAMRTKIEAGVYTPIIAKSGKLDLLRERNPFIMVGTLEPKKGHIPTVRAFEALWDAGMERALVIAGRKGWLEASVVHAIETSKYYNDKLFWFDDFDDFDLFYAYHYSRGLIFSSYAEGFGIPMVEALSAGRPVVAYDTPINREVLGKHGMMFDTFKDFAKHVLELDSDTGFQKACERAKTFSWPQWPDLVSGLFDRLTLTFGAKPQ